MIEQVKTINYWLMLLLVAFLWGASYYFTKHFAKTGLGYMDVMAVKMVFAGVALGPFIFRAYREIKHTRLMSIIAISALVLGFPLFYGAYCMTINTPPLLYIVQAFLPLLTFIFWLAAFDGEFTYRRLAGVLLGLIGVIVMMSMGSVISKSGKIISLFLYLLCMGGWGFGMLMLRRKLTNVSTISISSYSFYIMLVPGLLLCMTNEVPESVIKYEASRWGTFYSAILGIVCVAFGNYVYFRLVKKAGALFASTVTFLMPVFYFIFACFDNDMFTEHLNKWFFIGTALIVLGTFLTNKLDFDPTKKHRRKVNKYYYTR